MGKFIEISVTYADRDSDPNTSRNMGTVRWSVDDLTAPAEILTPLDPKAVLILKKYFKVLDEENENLKRSLGV